MAPTDAGVLETAASLQRMARLLGALRPKAALILVLQIACGALEALSLGMLVPLLSALSGADLPSTPFSRIASVFGASRELVVATAAAGALVLVAMKNLVAIGSAVLLSSVKRDAFARMRSLLLQTLLTASPDAFERQTSGNMANVFLAEGARTALALELMIQFVQRALLLLSYSVAILVISWKLTVLVLALGAVVLLMGVAFSRRILRKGRTFSAASEQVAKQLAEAFGGLRLIRSTHGESVESARFEVENRRQAEAEASAHRWSAALIGATETLGVGFAMLTTFVAYRYFLVAGELSVPEFLAFGFGLLRLLPLLNQLHGLQGTIMNLAPAVQQLHGWLSLPAYPSRAFGSAKLVEIREGITVRELGVRFASGHQALSEVTFELGAGSMLAVVGTSGAGKTTLANVLLRLREPTSGQITIDGQDYWSFDAKSFSRAVAYVEQDPFLFHATIAENLRYGAEDATARDLERVIAAVKLDEFVASLPRGLDTMVGERGATLSGGQRQRLAIARALVRSPKLLILDEPTSALDAETEQEVVDAIEAARAGRTTIVIAHRLSTIRRADVVLRLEAGKVVEQRSSADSVELALGAG